MRVVDGLAPIEWLIRGLLIAQAQARSGERDAALRSISPRDDHHAKLAARRSGAEPGGQLGRETSNALTFEPDQSTGAGHSCGPWWPPHDKGLLLAALPRTLATALVSARVLAQRRGHACAGYSYDCRHTHTYEMRVNCGLAE